MRRKSTRGWTAFAGLMMFAATANAQDRSIDLTTLSLEDLLKVSVITVTRSTQSAATAPGHVEVVTASDIQRRGYRSLLDVFRDMPGMKVDVAVDQDLFSDVTVQGTRGTLRIVVLLDGVRIVSPTAEPLPMLANYPVHNARQIEVVYGPASALYGADAFSAVVNIITREPGDSDRVQASLSGGQDGLWNTTASYAAKLSKRVALSFGAQVFDDHQPDLSRSYPGDFNGLASHQTGVFNTIFGPMIAGPRVVPTYALPIRAHSVQGGVKAGDVSVSAFQSSVRTPNTQAYTPDNAVYNDNAFQRNDLLVWSVIYARRVGRVETSTTFTSSRHELDPQSGYLNVFSGMQRSYKYAYGSALRGEHQSTWKPASSLSLSAGGDVERLRSMPQSADLAGPIPDRRQPGIILGTTIPDELFDVRYVNAGAYTQAQWAMQPRINVTAGIRADYNSRYHTVFNPRLGVVSPITSRTTLKLLYGTAYLAPSPYQSYARFGAFYSLDDGATYQSDFWHVPNRDLKPQHKRTVEASVDHILNYGFNVGASAFYSRFTDLVQESDVTSRNSGLYRGWPVTLLQQSVNSGREATYGGTVHVDYLTRPRSDQRIRLRSALSVADGHVTMEAAPGGRVETGGIAPLLWQTLADIDVAGWSMAGRIVTVSDQRAYATTTTADGRLKRMTVDGYTSADVTARRRLTAPLTLFATVENVFDARYRNLNLRAYLNPEEMVGSPQNPRRVMAGVEIRVR
jgi:outer membrane receptor for ferrienterochelin and colicin